MNKKIFTFLLALVASVGMMTAQEPTTTTIELGATVNLNPGDRFYLSPIENGNTYCTFPCWSAKKYFYGHGTFRILEPAYPEGVYGIAFDNVGGEESWSYFYDDLGSGNVGFGGSSLCASASPTAFTVTAGDGTLANPFVFTVNTALPCEEAVWTTMPQAVDGIIFSGEPQELITAGVASAGFVRYSLDNGATWSPTVPTATDAGTYTVHYAVRGSTCVTGIPYDENRKIVVSIEDSSTPVVKDTEDPSSVLSGILNTPSDLLVKRSIYADGYYNTLCLPFSITAEELAESTHPLYGYETLKTMRGAQVSGSGQDLTIDIFVEDATEIVAGQPYLISYPADRVGGNIVNPRFKDINVLIANSPSNVSADGVTFQGMLAPTHISSFSQNTTEDYLFLGEKNELTWPLNDGTDMRGFRAYFIIDRNQITPSMAPDRTRARLIDVQKMPTGVENVQGNKVQCTKVMVNGELHIIKNGVRYNAQGQMVK